MHEVIDRRLAILCRRACTGVAVLTALATGCNDAGVVPANGKILVDGQPVISGRLSLLPVGEGMRADSMVAEDGAFALRTGGVMGALPGSYRVVYSRSLADDGPQQIRKVSTTPVDEQTVVYQSPEAEPMVISEAGTEELVVDVRKDRGWSRDVSE